jgi:dipeptidyl aminopeptidase/acylaminoacyl peptidase
VLYHDGSLSFLTASRPSIPPEKVHNVSDYQYQARDGMTIPSLLTLPIHKEAKHLPAIIMPHGGPESYDRKGFDYMAQYFASQGYAVIQPQFRGSRGFGLQHLWAGRGEWGRKMQDDLTDAVIDLADKGVIDKDKVCIVGGSYGGYLALAGATLTPDVYQCAVSINGVADVDCMVRTDRKDYGSDSWVISYWERVIGNGEYKDDHLEAISPINHVEKVKIPILLIHGEYDSVVKYRQSRDMASALEDAGKQVELVKLPKGDHHLSQASNRMKAMLVIDQFLNEHLKK